MEEGEESDHEEKKVEVQNNFEKKYIMKEFIGKGHFGEVYKVQDKMTSRIYAVKVCIP